jgi:hypothetical protein
LLVTLNNDASVCLGTHRIKHNTCTPQTQDSHNSFSTHSIDKHNAPQHYTATSHSHTPHTAYAHHLYTHRPLTPAFQTPRLGPEVYTGGIIGFTF